VRLIGCTLWSDFEALVPAGGPLTQQLKAREKAERAADFYLRKTGTTFKGAGIFIGRCSQCKHKPIKHG
jgi:hypothetical protein